MIKEENILEIGAYIDIALIAIWVIMILVYFFKGFFNALKPFRKWVALIVACFTSGSVAAVLAPLLPLSGLRASLYDSFYDMWSSAIGELGSVEGVTADGLNGIFGAFSKLFSGITDACLGADGGELAAVAAGYAADKTLGAIVSAISFVAVFLAVFILYTIALKLVNALCKAPVLGFLNRLAGGIFGAVAGYFTLWLIGFILVTFLPHLLEGGYGFTMWVYGGAFSSYLLGLFV